MGRTSQLFIGSLCTSLLLLGACDASPTPDESGDAEFGQFPDGKADGGIDAGSDEAKAVLLLVNDPEVDFEELDDDARLNRRAASNIIAHRDGADELVGGGDDDLFDTLEELDDVRFVGSAALRALLEYATDHGYLAQVQGGGTTGDVMTDVIFSPQPSDATHNARVAELIATAQETIDVSMYSFSNAGVRDALEDAAARGVKIRFIFETANKDRKLTGAALLSSKSGRLEEAGIDVRYVNKIMHHKYMIIDGPRDDLGKAETATVATGSANWSNSAGTRYDENTLFLRGHEELTLRLQQEFNHLWNHSRDFVADPGLTFEPSEIEIADADIVDGPDTHAFFTSENFNVTTDTFRKNGGNEVSDQIIAAIADADTSIHIATGHLRHRGISEALMAKAQANPGMDIAVYLDAQEYVSPTTHDIQLDKLQDCLDDATTATQERNCRDKGFRFGFQIEEAGVDVRYKWYAQRWHFSYAAQMHHKYMVIDGDELWTGSYNLSDNAEHNTFENMLVFSGDDYADLVADYENNFASMWETGRADDLLSDLRDRVSNDDIIPLVFDSMALEHHEVRALKSLIVSNCPAVNTTDFRKNPEDHLICER